MEESVVMVVVVVVVVAAAMVVVLQIALNSTPELEINSSTSRWNRSSYNKTGNRSYADVFLTFTTAETTEGLTHGVGRRWDWELRRRTSSGIDDCVKSV
jgi:uncharacterized protein YpuA (DUF1002 family)